MIHLTFPAALRNGFAAIGMLSCCALEAAVISLPTSYSWSPGLTIPDNDPVGVSDTRTISGSPIVSITGLQVLLQLDSGFAGDLFVSLSHDSGFTVLLNRIGRTSTNVFGSDAISLDAVFSDGAATDIHLVDSSASSITGSFQPDGRSINPFLVSDTDPRTAFLDSFTSLDPNGSWTLFAADVSGGDEMVVQSWGLVIEGAIPEPGTSTLVAMVVAVGWWLRRR